MSGIWGVTGLWLSYPVTEGLVFVFAVICYLLSEGSGLTAAVKEREEMAEMFREMRRKRQELEERDCIEILKKGDRRSGGGGGATATYAVPLNYTHDEREKRSFSQRPLGTHVGCHPRK